MTDKPTEVTVELHEEGKRVTAHFRWEHAKWATATHAYISDGGISVHMSRRDAEELYRKLRDALTGQRQLPPEKLQEARVFVRESMNQDHADGGHPGTEEAMAEAEAQGEGNR